MKKVLLVLALIAFAAPAFAAQIDIDETGSDIGGATFKSSKSVIVSVWADSATYSAGSKHEAGTKGFGGLNADSNISEFTCAAGTTTKVTLANSTSKPTACQ